MATKHAGGFSQMPKMMTDEPSVILKLKKGGKVHKKEHHEEHGHHSMHHVAAKHHEGMHGHAEHGHAPKKPSMSERRKAMNPNQYAHGGKVHHKALGGAMPMGAAPMAAPMAPMAQAKLAQMAPAIRAARAMQVRKALTGMKKGGHAGMEKHIEKLEKELHHHEALSAKKAHHKASGGAIDKDETKTTIEHNEKPFVKTKVVDGDKHDKHHGTGEIKEKNAGGYKRGGKVHHKATGGDIPADTDKKKNPGKIAMHGTIEGNEHDFENTEMHEAKRDTAHGTGGVRMSNAGGYKHGGKTHHKIHHKFGGGGVGNAIEGNETKFAINNVDGTPKGKTNTKTGEVKEANGGGYKHGGHASKKAYATGGNVNDQGKAEKMPRHFVSRPVANSLQSGTFKKGGNVEKEEKANLRLLKTHTGPKGHVAKVYKDRDWDEHRVKFFSPEGKHYSDADYHTDDLSDAHDTAQGQLSRYRKGGKVHHFEEGGRLATPQAVGDPAPVSSNKPTSSGGTRLATPQAVNDPAPVSRPSAQKASQGKKRGGRAC